MLQSEMIQMKSKDVIIIYTTDILWPKHDEVIMLYVHTNKLSVFFPIRYLNNEHKRHFTGQHITTEAIDISKIYWVNILNYEK